MNAQWANESRNGARGFHRLSSGTISSSPRQTERGFVAAHVRVLTMRPEQPPSHCLMIDSLIPCELFLVPCSKFYRRVMPA